MKLVSFAAVFRDLTQRFPMEATKSTAEKMSLKNKHLRTGDYFAIIAFSTHSIRLTSYATG